VVKGLDVRSYLPPSAHDASYYQIQVKDNGIGFDQKDAEGIFTLFKRLHGRAMYEGTGIGLAIVQKVVENHRGYVWAESRPEQGSIFKVLLPVSSPIGNTQSTENLSINQEV
jgi:signal transduction histidine kinase